MSESADLAQVSIVKRKTPKAGIDPLHAADIEIDEGRKQFQ